MFADSGSVVQLRSGDAADLRTALLYLRPGDTLDLGGVRFSAGGQGVRPLKLNANGARLRNGAICDGHLMVHAEGATLEDLVLSSLALEIGADGDVLMRACRVEGDGGGVTVRRSGRLEAEDCALGDGTMTATEEEEKEEDVATSNVAVPAGLRVTGGGAARLLRCRTERCAFGWSVEGAGSVLEATDSASVGNARMNVTVMNGGRAELSRCALDGSQDYGVWVSCYDSRLTATGCFLDGNMNVNVIVCDQAQVRLVRCSLNGCWKGDGLVVDGQACAVVLDGGSVSFNAKSNVVVHAPVVQGIDGAEVVLARCTCMGSGTGADMVLDESEPGHARSRILVTDD